MRGLFAGAGEQKRAGQHRRTPGELWGGGEAAGPVRLRRRRRAPGRGGRIDAEGAGHGRGKGSRRDRRGRAHTAGRGEGADEART